MSESSVPVQATHRYSAAAERVFNAWLDPVLIGQFMFGPRLREEEVLRLNVDARVGGAFSFVVRRGESTIDHVGTYQVIERPRRLGFTWGVAGQSQDESHVLIEIVPLADGCELTLTHHLPARWADYAARTQLAWSLMLNALAEVVAPPT